MVKISKSELPQGVKIRTENDYRSKEVLQIIQRDFFNKYYLCEEKEPTSINVEHLCSQKHYKQMKREWGNLFFSCAHCNRIKGSNYDQIINCTKEDPEKYIGLKFYCFPNNRVEVLERMDGGKNKKTMELLDKIYNGPGTPVSNFEAENLKSRISKEVDEFRKCIFSYQEESDLKLKEVYREKIRKMLSRESNFAGFKRNLVYENKEYMQYFGDLL